jgi:hypothetical protein
MSHKHSEMAFIDTVKAVQQKIGGRAAYARREAGPNMNDRLGPDEAAFIPSRESFHIAFISETGWPYVQFRGGPPGFLRRGSRKTNSSRRSLPSARRWPPCAPRPSAFDRLPLAASGDRSCTGNPGESPHDDSLLRCHLARPEKGYRRS